MSRILGSSSTIKMRLRVPMCPSPGGGSDEELRALIAVGANTFPTQPPLFIGIRIGALRALPAEEQERCASHRDRGAERPPARPRRLDHSFDHVAGPR